MPDFLLDTNHMSNAIRPVSRLRDRIREVYRQGSKLGTCWSVLCELERAIIQSKKPEKMRRTLNEVLTQVRIWPMAWPIVLQFGLVALLCKSRGRSLSFVDLELASRAMLDPLTVLTSDKDFSALPEIRCENWLP